MEIVNKKGKVEVVGVGLNEDYLKSEVVMDCPVVDKEDVLGVIGMLLVGESLSDACRKVGIKEWIFLKVVVTDERYKGVYEDMRRIRGMRIREELYEESRRMFREGKNVGHVLGYMERYMDMMDGGRKAEEKESVASFKLVVNEPFREDKKMIGERLEDIDEDSDKE